MRHLKKTAKLGRQFEHRNAMLANLVCSLIKHKRVTTTLAKAKAARSVAEKMITLGKKNTLHARRLVAARLHTRGTSLELSKAEYKQWRQNDDIIRILFEDVAPVFKTRNGGYTRIIKIGIRHGDAAAMSVLQLTTLAAELESAKGGDKKKKAAGTGRRARAKAAANAGTADATLPATPSRKRAAG